MEKNNKLTNSKKRIFYITKFLNNNTQIFSNISNEIYKTFNNSGKIFFCGNGGSAAECQHIAAEFTATLHKNNRVALPAMSLSSDNIFLTAYSNDFNYVNIFKRQLEAFAKRNDICFVISTSGKSKNIINAIKYCKANEIKVIGLFGRSKDFKYRNLTDFEIFSGCKDTQISQEIHLMALHIIANIVDSKFK